MGYATALINFHGVIVFRYKKIQHFGNRSRLHVGFKYFAHLRNFKSCFFLCFPSYAIFGVIIVQQAGASFNEHAGTIAVNKSRHTELPGEDDGFLHPVLQHNGGDVSPVVGFPALHLAAAVTFYIFAGNFFKRVPVVG